MRTFLSQNIFSCIYVLPGFGTFRVFIGKKSYSYFGWSSWFSWQHSCSFTINLKSWVPFFFLRTLCYNITPGIIQKRVEWWAEVGARQSIFCLLIYFRVSRWIQIFFYVFLWCFMTFKTMNNELTVNCDSNKVKKHINKSFKKI